MATQTYFGLPVWAWADRVNKLKAANEIMNLMGCGTAEVEKAIIKAEGIHGRMLYEGLRD